MKLNIKSVFVVFLFAFFLAGCQFAGTSSEAAVNTNTSLQNKKEKDSTEGSKESENRSEEIKIESSEAEEEGKEEENESNDTSEKSDAEVPEGLAVGANTSVQNVEVTLLGVREIVVDYVTASNDKFIGVELKIANNGNEPVKISSLPQMFLIVADKPQDIALIETKGQIDQTVEPGNSITGEIAFDSVQAEVYQFIYRDSKEEAVWTFTDGEITKPAE